MRSRPAHSVRGDPARGRAFAPARPSAHLRHGLCAPERAITHASNKATKSHDAGREGFARETAAPRGSTGAPPWTGPAMAPELHRADREAGTPVTPDRS